MRSKDIPLVRELDLFAEMAESNFDALMQAAFLQRFPPQVQLITEGEPADFLYVMVEGSVELFANGNGRETTIEIINPVATFILAAALRDQSYLMSARTIENARILMIPSETVREVFASDAAFARAVVRELSGRFRTVVKALKNQKLRNAVERLANYLVRKENEQGADGAITLQIDKRTLAALLGMTPENLSRAFGTLKPYGVEVKGREIRLTKTADLAALAKPNPLIDDPAS
ncbi:MAG TPA: cyclic nucleotide-binding domain-containing protein [Kiloniellaceae bacterium]|nr:cyclic nucleotide-binding domain-containing protein [Kiloniellaceae bacterium]HIP78599.1 cyclic nucleotide-binding domain-containing protein [Kiloniellaceae bacterium]